ncbi:MAG: nucleotidyltransferase domain-containing protein [Brevinematales bacterium]|nr:nucleotidyltransferase domain-containing protein [Brevinematales bacterium]
MDTLKKDRVINSLREILSKAGYQVHSVYLFGSRANGTENKDSDYDFFFVLKASMNREDLIKFRIEIKKRLKEKFPRRTFDILSRNLTDFNYYKKVINFIDNTVVMEGKRII